MPNCCLVGCPNRTKGRQCPEISYHVFPKDKKLACVWTKAIRCSSLCLPKRPYLCSAHFTSDCFDLSIGQRNILTNSSGWKRRLLPGSVPTIFQWSKQHATPRVTSTARAEKRQRKEIIQMLLEEDNVKSAPGEIPSKTPDFEDVGQETLDLVEDRPSTCDVGMQTDDKPIKTQDSAVQCLEQPMPKMLNACVQFPEDLSRPVSNDHAYCRQKRK